MYNNIFSRAWKYGPKISWEQGAVCTFSEQGAQYFWVNVWDNSSAKISPMLMLNLFYAVKNL